jgi:indole-3-glycerol phosphate synthase
VPDFLMEMAAASRQRAAEAQRRLPESALRPLLANAPPVHPPALHGFLLIAEVKRISPAEGVLVGPGEQDVTRRAADYAAAGAGAISVLTEPARFGGSEDDLRAIARSLPAPVMRKDFLTCPYQVLEARAWGASGVLLIIKILSDGELAELLSAAVELGMFALVEAFDREDLARAASLLERHGHAATPILLGLNTRDLRDLRIRPERLVALADAFPPGWPRIAESGVASAEDVRHAATLGYDGALVGTALMRAADPLALCRDMVRAGNAVRRQEARP